MIQKTWLFKGGHTQFHFQTEISINSTTSSFCLSLFNKAKPSIFPSIKVFFNELALLIKWPKYWSFSFSISPSNNYSGLISFRNDCFELLAVQGTLKSLLQCHSSKPSVLALIDQSIKVLSINSSLLSLLYGLSHPYMTTAKTIALTVWTFVGEVIALLFSILSRFITAFLTRSKCLLIS